MRQSSAALPAARRSAALEVLRTELASTPRRQRATLRIVLATLIATTVVAGFHIPEGHWLIITILIVSQPDAGESLTKGIHRLLGTLIGGAAAILTVIAAGDQPWLLVPTTGIAIAFALFVSRTCTAPYAAMMAALTFVLVALARVDSPTAAIEVGLWRIWLLAIGVAIATAVQLLVWPDDPEEFLLDDLARRLAEVEGILGGLLDRPVARPSRPGPVPLPAILAASGLAGQLDLLASAEARHPAIRRRHPEQVALIIEVERLVTGSLWLQHMAALGDRAVRVDDALRARLRALREGCALVRSALAERRALPENALGPVPARPADEGAGRAFLATLANMEQSLGRIPPATAFLGPPGESPAASPVPGLDAPAATPLLTPDFWAADNGAIRFALKAALALVLSYLIMLGLDWPSIFTCVVTCVIVAQSTLGATVNKSLLRLAGASLGTLLAFLVIVLVMPNIETLLPYLIATAAGFGVVAWITTGSSRISYVGVQAGVALALALVDATRPTTDLLVARDRVLGVILGIAVMMAIDHAVWPVHASRSMRPALAAALRALGRLAAMRPVRLGYAGRVAHAAELRGQVYRQLAAALRLREEARLEPGASSAEAHEERERMLRLTGDIQAVFLALLVLARHRLTADLGDLPGPLAEAIEEFHDAVSRELGDLAGVLENQPPRPGPALAAELDRLEHVASVAEAGGGPGLGPGAVASLHGLLGFDRELVALIAHLRGDVEEAAVRPPRPEHAR